MPHIAIGVEYDGSSFHGWQRQSEVITIQEVIEKALSQVADHSIKTICAGRTDAGVHAIEQVIHFDTLVHRDPYAWIAGTNALLHPAIRVLWATEVSPDFSARKSATSRQYRYVIYNHSIKPGLMRQYVSWHYKTLQIQRMQEAAEYWIGEHDFTSFRAEGCQSFSPNRNVESINILRLNSFVVIEIKANAFLHHMVRNMVGTLYKIGDGSMSPDWAKEVLEAKARKIAGATAEPQGLYLLKVNYPKRFNIPELSSRSLFNPFEEFRQI